ncbi:MULTISPECIES: glycosyltransferase [Pantoea]|uniref:Glycosyl transferase n=2 Tax=Pantoea TaxID=53335 RepID=A0A0U3BZX5_9GAMM|nr:MULTISPECIES: glycosyltransferase [Pantoea]ALV94183.1 glycosyl transferase [Pantoea vagans]KHJ69633.1 glycosyl transferase [Pantoea rodasii]
MVIDGLPGGGAEKVVLTLVAGMLALGHRVSLFSLRKVCEYPLPEGVDYHVIQDTNRKPWRKLTELSRRARLLDAAVRKAEKEGGQFDLVVSHLHKTDRIVRRSRALRQEKTWCCLHGVFSASYLGHRTGLSRWLKARKIRQVYQGRNVVGVSPAVLEDLKSAFAVQPSREAVIGNPFDVEQIRQLAAEPADVPPAGFLVHVGRFHETKRHDRLLKAYALSNIQQPLVLLGQGSPERKAALQAQAQTLGIADRVIFQGFTLNPYAWISRATMLIVSSDSEGFGNVLIEAMLCGTPVVSTRCPGGPEWLLQGDLARGLSELNPESLAEKMQEIYQHPPLIQADAFAGFDTLSICQQYLALSR